MLLLSQTNSLELQCISRDHFEKYFMLLHILPYPEKSIKTRRLIRVIRMPERVSSHGAGWISHRNNRSPPLSSRTYELRHQRTAIIHREFINIHQVRFSEPHNLSPVSSFPCHDWGESPSSPSRDKIPPWFSFWP